MFQEDSIETCILSRVKQITSPGWMHETRARAWCTGKTQRDWVEREVGGGIGMGNTCKSMADSCQCMTKNFCIIQKFMWNHRPTIARAIFGAGGRKSGSMTLPDFRQYYKATVNKTVCTWYKNRHANEWNSIESPEINLYIYGQLILNEESKNKQWEKESLLSKWCWESWTAPCK